MMKFKRRAVLFALAVLLSLQATSSQVGFAAETDARATLKDLSFLKGTWSGAHQNGAYVEEYWSAPRDDSMIGHCRFIKDSKTTFLELLAIVNTPSGIVMRMKHCNGEFVAWPEKEEAGDCLLTGYRAGEEAVFDNKRDEHRVKVTYKKTGPRSLSVIVEDIADGKTSTFPFDFKLIE
jgi:hypothetical protein